jgi:hypothetical protein
MRRIEHALFRALRGALTDLLHFLLARDLHGDVRQLLHDGVDVTADVADLGELGGLDFDERSVGEAREPARDLGLADAGGPDHQDVLRRDLLAQGLGHLHAPPAVAQRNGHRALGVVLADNVFIQLRNYFFGGKIIQQDVTFVGHAG